MLNNISIQTKLLSALAIIIIINIVSGGFIAKAVMKAESAAKDVEHISEIQWKISEIEDSTFLARSFVISFLNSGDLKNKKLYQSEITKTEPLFNELYKLTDDQKLIEHAKLYQKHFDQWREEIAKSQIQYMLSPDTVDMARLIETSGKNKEIWDSILHDRDILAKDIDEQTKVKSAILNQSMSTASKATMISLSLTIVVILGASVLIIFMVSKPLQQLVKSTEALVEKKWNTVIDGINRGDEIGQMAKALVLFRDNGLQNEKLMAAQQMEDQQRVERAKKIEKLVDNFRHTSSDVTAALEVATEKMSTSSVTMGDIANDTNRLSADVLQSAQSAGMNVNNVSAATEELTASIQEISSQLSRTSAMAQQTQNISDETVEKMHVLEHSANEINSVVQIISDIADQTNLLALNATIEAARAGEAGKGFAVVANEVKTLASETAQATDQVIIQISRIQGDTKDAVNFFQQISESITELTHSMTAIAAAMEEQTAATLEISRNVQEASQGTNTVVKSIDNVTASTMQTQETSMTVSDIAKELKERSAVLTQSINSFITNIQNT